LTACFPLESLVNVHFFDHDALHHLGEGATHPIEPPWGALAALLLLAGRINEQNLDLILPSPGRGKRKQLSAEPVRPAENQRATT